MFSAVLSTEACCVLIPVMRRFVNFSMDLAVVLISLEFSFTMSYKRRKFRLKPGI